MMWLKINYYGKNVQLNIYVIPFLAFPLLFYQLKEQLMDLQSYDTQFEFVTSKIMEAQPDLSREDIVFSMEGFVQRVKTCLGYKPEGKHRGDIVFVKASQGSEIMSVYGLDKDYDLGKVRMSASK